MFETIIKEIEPDRVTHFSMTRNGSSISFADALELWKSNSNFCRHFSKTLADSKYSGFRWETPGLSRSQLNRAFEFVLLNCPSFSQRKTDSRTYAQYFKKDDDKDGVVCFENLGGDAALIVPTPLSKIDAYGHLADFVRFAPEEQQRSLWRATAIAVESRLGESSIWISTAGGGVAWLHVRIDSRPKYYGYSPYKTG